LKGEYDEAIKEYKKALEIAPDYKPAKVNLSLLYYMKGPVNKDRCASSRFMEKPGHKEGRRQERPGIIF